MTISPVTNTKPPAPSLLVGEEDLCRWLGEASPGSTIEYHHGYLALDRDRDLSSFADKDRRELCALADRLASLASENRVLLTQRRAGPDEFRYLAIKPRHAARTRPSTRRAA